MQQGQSGAQAERLLIPRQHAQAGIGPLSAHPRDDGLRHRRRTRRRPRGGGECDGPQAAQALRAQPPALPDGALLLGQPGPGQLQGRLLVEGRGGPDECVAAPTGQVHAGHRQPLGLRQRRARRQAQTGPGDARVVRLLARLWGRPPTSRDPLRLRRPGHQRHRRLQVVRPGAIAAPESVPADAVRTARTLPARGRRAGGPQRARRLWSTVRGGRILRPSGSLAAAPGARRTGRPCCARRLWSTARGTRGLRGPRLLSGGAPAGLLQSVRLRLPRPRPGPTAPDLSGQGRQVPTRRAQVGGQQSRRPRRPPRPQHRCRRQQGACLTHARRQPGHRPTQGRHAIGAGQAQALQRLPGGRQRRSRWLIDPGQPRAVGHAPHGQLQGRTGEVGREDLRGRSQRRTRPVRRRAAAVDDAGPLAPRPPGPLHPGRPRDPHRHQATHGAGHVQARLTRQRGVHHHPHPGHRQRGLGHVRGHHDAPPPRRARGQGRVLGARGQAAVQRQDVHALVNCTAQAGDDVVDLAGPGQEDQHVAGALGQGPLHGGGDVGEELPRHPARPQAAGAPRRRPHLL